MQLQQGAQVFDYRYDPSDYRIGINAGIATRDFYLEGEHLEAVYGPGGLLTDKYLRGVVIDEVINGYHYDWPNKEKNLTFHHDHLNSVTAVTGHDGTTVETASYGPFGAMTSETGPALSGGEVANKLRYTGREFDRETGLYYYRARYYDPEIGRFYTEDPLRFRAGINFYAYVNNNPLNARDPSGMTTLSVEGEIRLPQWAVESVEAITGQEYPIIGIHFGIAHSITSASGRVERDWGISFGGIAKGLDYGLGKVSTSVGIYRDAVQDLAGTSMTGSATIFGSNGGLVFSTDGQIQGGQIGPAIGISAGITPKITDVYSLKHGYIEHGEIVPDSNENITNSSSPEESIWSQIDSWWDEIFSSNDNSAETEIDTGDYSFDWF